MTKEGVDYNLSRLEYFLGYEGHLPRLVSNMSDAEVLLQGYSRLMDFSGCGRDQLSRLFLIESDYDELDECVHWCNEYKKTEDFHSSNIPTGPTIMMRGNITFQWDQYTFWAFKVDSYPVIKNVQP